MASGIEVSWQPGPGLEPPPPHAADSFKGFVLYRGGWMRAWDFDDEGNTHRLGSPDMPNGIYRIRVYGHRNGVYSLPAEKEYEHTTGTSPIDPVAGEDPPEGDSSVATPEMLTVTEAA